MHARWLLLLGPLAGCTNPEPPSSEPPAQWDRGPNPHAQDDLLRYDHIQVKGTHNSYHQEPPTLFDDSHAYSHPTLTDQLDLYGVRQFELDLHRTTDDRWEVFHLPGIDAETSCLRFADCLQEIKDWSDDNGWHLPITIWIEPKDELDALTDGYRAITDDDLFTIDTDVRAVWPEDRIFSPDDLRGDEAALPDALAQNGWPTLDGMRGQVLFALLDAGAEREAYLAPSEILLDRVLFADTSTPSDPWGALVKDGSPADITAWVEQGFVITDNGSGAADSNEAAEASDTAILDAGVHHAATDLPGPTDPDRYWLDLAPRCNPVRAPMACDDAQIEILDVR